MPKETDLCPVNREEVKKNLRACAGAGGCWGCGYRHYPGNCIQLMASDVLAYVEYLEGRLNDVSGKV